MKKKMILILLAIAMLATMFVACGENTTTNPNENEVLDTGVPNTDTSTPDTDTDTDTTIPEETPIVEGVFFEHKNGWYRCEPLENGMYKYEIYSTDMQTTYSIELPVFSEDMDFEYKWNEEKKSADMTFINNDLCVQIVPCIFDSGIFEVKKESFGNLTNNSAGETFYEHTVDTPDLDIYMYDAINVKEDIVFFRIDDYDYPTKCLTRVFITSLSYTLDEQIEYAKTWSKTKYESDGRDKNLISSIDGNVTKTFGVNDISSKVKENHLNLGVMGNYDWIRTSSTDPTLYKELTLNLFNSDYSSISKDTVVEIVEELFGDKELYVYGTEDKLSEFPTYTNESTPYFYYYVDEDLYGVVSISDRAVVKLNIAYYKK